MVEKKKAEKKRRKEEKKKKGSRKNGEKDECCIRVNYGKLKKLNQCKTYKQQKRLF